MQNGLSFVSARILDFSRSYRDAAHDAAREGVEGFCAALDGTRGTLSVAHATVRDDFGPSSGMHPITAAPT